MKDMSYDNSQTNRQQLPAPPAWTSQDRPKTDEHVDRRATLRARMGSIYQALCMPDFINSIAAIGGAHEKVEQLKATVQSIEEELDGIPTIKVALLGPSRHGKSTLLNALAACSILPMSDIKPCTASIVSLKRADEWGFEIHFISQKRLERERRRAVADAKEYLSRIAKKMMGDEEPDDPRYLHSTLQRFIQLFEIDPDLSPNELINAIDSADIPQNIQRLLGQVARPRSSNVEQMKGIVEKYLSTKDIYWTIVDTCEISGPFENWHPNLQLVDVPGTNDTDPQRTAITNSLRRTAKAVAICTSDSNLGNDIQSWLRNSSVLGDFLEATEQSRQHLFILRTKFDSYHPEVDESQIDEEDEDSEDRLYRAAIERHKEQQTESYREMFRNIAAPLLPQGNSPEEQQKREEMVERINGIRVFFVSALAHEAFAGRLKAGARQKRRLSEHFQNDPEATGIPSLKQFANEMAETYLSEFYYDDLERQLETEVDRLVRFFRQQWTTLEAEVGGGSQAIAELVEEIDESILPWLKDAVDAGTKQFQRQASESSKSISQQLTNTERSLTEKLSHRQLKWHTYYWNSLQAAARKKGIHTTCRGHFIDINQDICGLFVDDLALSWSTYRDSFVRNSTEMIADEISSNLQAKLDEAAGRADVPEATAAIDAIVTNLSTISRSQRDEFRRQVDAAIQEMESIRKPAYEAIQQLMIPTYRAIAFEGGTGCQERMRTKLCNGANANVKQMWAQVSRIVAGAVTGLEGRTATSLAQYGQAATSELRKSINHLKEIGKVVHREKLLQQREHIRTAALLLWQALSDAGKLLITAPKPAPIALAAVTPMLNPPPPSAQVEEAPKPLPTTTEESPSPGPTAATDKNGESVRVDTPHVSFERLCECPVYLVQKERAGRTAPDDDLVLRILGTLQDHHWKMTLAALSERVEVPAFRLRSMLPAVQRVLNLDGQQIMQTCRTSDSVELNESLLRQEFSI